MDNLNLGKYEISKKKAIVICIAILALGAVILNWKAVECTILLLANPSAYESVCVAALG